MSLPTGAVGLQAGMAPKATDVSLEILMRDSDQALIRLDGDEEKDSSHLSSDFTTEAELGDLPLDFSFSQYLSPAGKAGSPIIKNNGTILTATHLVALALNEKCREIRQGAFYCMHGRQKHLAHPCDVVFINESWREKGNKIWDASNWKERLEFVQATKIDPSEKVIPICVRVLKFDTNSFSVTPESSDAGDALLTSPSEEPGLLFDYPVKSPIADTTYPYATSNDPVIKPAVYQYSRRIEDLSTYLLTYNSQLSTPFLCLTGASEHELHSISCPTLNDLSTTFARRCNIVNDLLSDSTLAGDRATELIVQGSVSSHTEVVHTLIKAWNSDEELGMEEPDQQLFGRVTYLWQELLNRIEGNVMYDGTFDMSMWPGST